MAKYVKPAGKGEVHGHRCFVPINAYNQLRRFILRKNVRSIDESIYSFSSEPVWPVCIVDVSVKIGETTNMKFFVMNINSPSNGILGRNWLRQMKAMASPFHQKIKFSFPEGVVVVRGKQEDAQYCFNIAV